ncbi:MAG: 3-deoxy-D-manno-octulosonic acid transferase [Gemmatimonadota bacterium]|nr:3-deoxy-D-manno-octulosonic acid transferase [Gemmatimonadota bacterium]
MDSLTGRLRDLAVGAGFLAFAVGQRLRTGRWRSDARTRNGKVGKLRRRAPGPRILVHGVSVGETNALVPLIEALGDSPAAPDVVVSASTSTGFGRARQLHGGSRDVVRFPLDLTWIVSRFLDAVRPDAVVLAELELWPTFMAECARRGIPVCVVNGRLSASSFRGYRTWRPLVRPMFSRLALVVAQTEVYRARFVELGVPGPRAVVGGSLKWDAAQKEPDPAEARALASAMGIEAGKPLIVAGSTGPGEEAALIRDLPQGCQLLLAPRNPDRWDEVAALVPGMRRRSMATVSTLANDASPPSPDPPVFLLDTIGELTTAYLLADAVFVGRSLAPMGGSNPLEPVAAGKPTAIGPHHEHFEDIVTTLSAAGALKVSDEPMRVIAKWIRDSAARKAVVRAGKRALSAQRGVSARTAGLVLGVLTV